MPKKKEGQISPKNQLVRSLGTTDYIKNPLAYTQVRGGLSLMQTNVIVGIAAALQDRIEHYLKSHETSGYLFRDEDFEDSLLTFNLSMKEMGIKAKDYAAMEKDGRELASTSFSYMEERDGQRYMTTRNLFHSISFPVSSTTKDGGEIKYASGQRRTGIIKVRMHKECVNDLLNMKKGYVEHMKDIVPLCRCSRTPRLYIYLSAWFDRGYCDANYLDLKEYLGALTFDNKHINVVEDKYKRYKDFQKRILEPIRLEMDRLAAENKIDFSFTYETRYAEGRKKGNPQEIEFKIIFSEHGRARRREQKVKRLQARLIEMFRINPDEWKQIEFLVTDESLEMVKDQLTRIKKLVEEHKPDCVHAYVTTVLVEWLKKFEPTNLTPAEEIKPDVPSLSQEETQCWTNFTALLTEALGENFADIYISCSELYRVNADKTVLIHVPSRFVAEKWHEHREQVNEAFTKAWRGYAGYQYVTDEMIEDGKV